MKSCSSLVLLFAVATTEPLELRGCEPGGIATNHGGFGDKGTGVFTPDSVAQMTAPRNPSVYVSMPQHHQALAAQAAAYRAARRPLTLAKAYAMRQATLAARESRRAWVLANQDERKRATLSPNLQTAPELSAPAYVAMRAVGTRSLAP